MRHVSHSVFVRNHVDVMPMLALRAVRRDVRELLCDLVKQLLLLPFCDTLAENDTFLGFWTRIDRESDLERSTRRPYRIVRILPIIARRGSRRRRPAIWTLRESVLVCRVGRGFSTAVENDSVHQIQRPKPPPTSPRLRVPLCGALQDLHSQRSGLQSMRSLYKVNKETCSSRCSVTLSRAQEAQISAMPIREKKQNPGLDVIERVSEAVGQI